MLPLLQKPRLPGPAGLIGTVLRIHHPGTGQTGTKYFVHHLTPFCCIAHTAPHRSGTILFRILSTIRPECSLGYPDRDTTPASAPVCAEPRQSIQRNHTQTHLRKSFCTRSSTLCGTIIVLVRVLVKEFRWFVSRFVYLHKYSLSRFSIFYKSRTKRACLATRPFRPYRIMLR